MVILLPHSSHILVPALKKVWGGGLNLVSNECTSLIPTNKSAMQNKAISNVGEVHFQFQGIKDCRATVFSCYIFNPKHQYSLGSGMSGRQAVAG